MDDPRIFTPGIYKIWVRTIGADTVGISAAFTISNAKIPLTQPSNDVTWKTGETHLIQWTRSGPMDNFDAHPNYFAGTPIWEIKANVVPGQRFYTLSKKRDGLKNQIEHKVSLGVILLKGSDSLAPIMDIEHRNNIFEKAFHR